MEIEYKEAYEQTMAAIPVRDEIKTGYRALLETVFIAGIAEGTRQGLETLKRANDPASK